MPVRMFYTRPSDGATYCFEPVPLLAESKEFLKTAGGDTRLATVHTLTFNGTLLPTLPALSGVPTGASCIQLLDRKSDQLCSALSEDRGNLLVVDGSGYPIIKANPIVQSLEFEESQIVNHRKYSVIFEYESDFGNNAIKEYVDTWSFNQQEDDTVAASHTISAVGIAGSLSSILNAKAFVKPRLGFDVSQSEALNPPIVPALIAISGLSPFNHIVSETIDNTAGSYEVTETWVLASGSFRDDRTTDISSELDETNNLIETVTINGNIQGYGDTTFEKFTNAKNAFNTFVVPQIGFNDPSGISAKTISRNRFAGTVTYSITRIPDGAEQQLVNRSISRTFERGEDGSVTQTVTTSASVRQGSASGIQAAINYCFANNTVIGSTEPIFDASLGSNLVSVNTSRDDITKTFSLTRSYIDQTTALYREEYDIQRQQNFDSSVTNITINGTVQGLGTETGTKSKVRFASASGAYFGTIEGLITSRAASIIPVGACINSSPISTTLGFNELAGTITYSQTFESRFKTTNGAILKEEVQVSFTNQSQVIAEISIPGKADGPILQNQETLTGLEKDLNITYSLKRQPDACTNINAVTSSNVAIQTALGESDILVNNTVNQNARGEKPVSSKVFKVEDRYSFNRQTYVFTRNVKWKYI